MIQKLSSLGVTRSFFCKWHDSPELRDGMIRVAVLEDMTMMRHLLCYLMKAYCGRLPRLSTLAVRSVRQQSSGSGAIFVTFLSGSYQGHGAAFNESGTIYYRLEEDELAIRLSELPGDAMALEELDAVKGEA